MTNATHEHANRLSVLLYKTDWSPSRAHVEQARNALVDAGATINTQAERIASLSRDLEEAREWKRIHPCSCEFNDDVDNPEAIRLCFYHQAREREVLEARTIAIRSRQDAYNALTACRPIVAGLIDAKYNIETWGLRGRLAAIDAALAARLSRASDEKDSTA